MPGRQPGLLKVFAAEPEEAAPDASSMQGVQPADEMSAISQVLSRATGWRFRYEAGGAKTATLPDTEGRKSADPHLEWSAPVNPGVGAALGHLKMDRPVSVGGTEAKPQAKQSAAQELGTLVAELISGRVRLEQALREREAELATGVPIVVQPRATSNLAERLAAVLRGGAESLDFQAAAMYLLDDETSELKLRAEWGLGVAKLAEPARPLAGALADLEAMCGHAVVLEDGVLMDLWKVPEPCGAAICVPISGPSSVLGTLWFYSAVSRKFTATQTNLAEILAGRLAAELDREALVRQLQANRGNSLTASTGSGLTAAIWQS